MTGAASEVPSPSAIRLVFPLSWRIGALVTLLVVFGIFLASFRFQGRMLWLPVLGSGLALMSCALWSGDLWSRRVELTEALLRRRVLFWTSEIRLADVASVSFSGKDGTIVVSSGGTQIRVPVKLRGFAAFATGLLKRVRDASFDSTARACLETFSREG